MKEIIGYSRKEVPTLAHWFEKLYPDPQVRRKISDAWFERISRQGYISGGEAEITAKNGDRRALLFKAVQMGSGDVLFFAQDITERKEAEQMLREAKDRFEELFKGANELIITTDADGYIKRVNRKAMEASGFNRDELVGESILKMAHPEDRDKYIEFWKRILEGEEPTYRLRGVNKEGDTIHLMASGRPIVEDGEIAEIQYNAQDITELEKTQRKLEKRKAELEKKTEELESFVYTVSHDLRTPLVSLEGFSEMLMEEYEAELGEEGKHYLDRIKGNVAKMDDFIEDLLQLSRIGRKEAPKEMVEIEGVVGNVMDELSARIEEKGIKVEVGEDLP